MLPKTLYITILVITIFAAGCTSVQPTVVENVPTPVAVTQTYVTITDTPTEIPGPAPTNDMGACFNRSDSVYPDYCYDYYYWVKPTTTPVGMGYTAKVWQNSSCVYRNRTSDECEMWGDDSWTAIFMKNLTVVRNISGINITEVVAAASYYNDTWGLNVVNGADFNSFVKAYWNGIYPDVKYDKSLFAPDKNVSVVVTNATFNPAAF